MNKRCIYCDSEKDLIFDEFGMIYICKECHELESGNL